MLQTRLLDHPHIVKLLTVDIIDGILIMVMEYIEGTDLEKILDKSSSLEIKTALTYFKQILSALAFAHQKSVIHRDIRPSNVLINLDDDVKIADFGTSTLLQEKQFATTKIGSPPYMAPEQFEGKAVFASDIYSAGCLFYEMVTGFPPDRPGQSHGDLQEGQGRPVRAAGAEEFPGVAGVEPGDHEDHGCRPERALCPGARRAERPGAHVRPQPGLFQRD